MTKRDDFLEWERTYAQRYGEEAIRWIKEGEDVYARIAGSLAASHAMAALEMRELKFPIKVSHG